MNVLNKYLQIICLPMECESSLYLIKALKSELRKQDHLTPVDLLARMP